MAPASVSVGEAGSPDVVDAGSVVLVVGDMVVVAATVVVPVTVVVPEAVEVAVLVAVAEVDEPLPDAAASYLSMMYLATSS